MLAERGIAAERLMRTLHARECPDGRGMLGVYWEGKWMGTVHTTMFTGRVRVEWPRGMFEL